jgi:oligopeptide transport system permease protein
MGQYVIRRVVQLVPVLLAVYTLTFLLFQLTPGGPWSKEKPLPKQAIEALNAKYGIDKPIYVQYVTYLVNAVTKGDLGPSYKQTSRTVTEIIGQFFPFSVVLGLTAIALALLIGIPLGIVSALKHNTTADYGSMFLAVLGVSVPTFVFGPILIYFLSVKAGLLPSGSAPTGGAQDLLIPANWKFLLMPAITLSLAPLALLARYTRAAMLEVIRMDYIRTARAKGLVEQAVIVRHALRNALIPVVTVAGVLVAEVLVGSFYVEFVFNWPGIGRYFVTSVTNRDYPVLMGATLLFAFVVAIMNLLVDITYAYLDPRIRYR